MGRLKDNNFETEYRTLVSDAIDNFYIPCLKSSNQYLRSVGYFRSSIFLIIGPEIIEFAKKGGKISLICSHELDANDIEAIIHGNEEYKKRAKKKFDEEVEYILKESHSNYSCKVLATLISCSIMTVKIAFKIKPNSGIYHEKMGIFIDEYGDMVSFTGSKNETWSAWEDHEGNHENIEVFSSWVNDDLLIRTSKHKNYYEQLWNDRTLGLSIEEISENNLNKLTKISEKDLDSIDVNKIRIISLKNLQKVYKNIENLRDYQEQVLKNWEKNNYQGIFELATGSGKTVTALKAIDDHTKNGQIALVLVPSSLLLKQWEGEINKEIDNPFILLAGDGNTKWKKNLDIFSLDIKTERRRIILATMQTGSSDQFLDEVKKIKNLLIVIDETHQIGSDKNSKALEIDAQKRIGLSATPKRHNDPKGTQKIYDYFNGVIEPKFSIFDAIGKALVKYTYHPHMLNLSQSESDEWTEVSKKIRKEIAQTNSKDKPFFLSSKAKLLLIQRSRIAKKTDTKIQLAKKVIEDNYEPGQKWLIYCEDSDQLKKVKEILSCKKILILEYYSNMKGDQSQTLELFQHQGGILVSIKCLDEGVDIPSISHAMILASSQNPRQFIQRRGRVLRKHDSKIYAEIHDALVTPVSLENEPDQLALLKSEIIRAYEFSKYALNNDGGIKLKQKAIQLGFNIDEIIDDGFEEEEIA